MTFFSIEGLSELGLNPYEAIIVAAQHARGINTKRLKLLEKLEEDPTIPVDPRKITMVALKDVLEGKVKFTRADSE